MEHPHDFSSKTQGTLWKKGLKKKKQEPEGGKDAGKCCPQELVVAVVARSRSRQSTFQHGGGWGRRSPSLARELCEGVSYKGVASGKLPLNMQIIKLTLTETETEIYVFVSHVGKRRGSRGREMGVRGERVQNTLCTQNCQR